MDAIPAPHDEAALGALPSVIGGPGSVARFGAQTAGLPQTTEIERLVIQRIGQDIFRAALMDTAALACA